MSKTLLYVPYTLEIKIDEFGEIMVYDKFNNTNYYFVHKPKCSYSTNIPEPKTVNIFRNKMDLSRLLESINISREHIQTAISGLLS